MNKNNQVTLIGNLGNDVRINKKKEMVMAAFSLATSDSYKDKKGEWQKKKAIWHNVLVFHDKVIEVAKDLKKGARIEINGSLSYRDFDVSTGKNKITKREASIIAHAIKSAPLSKASYQVNSEPS